MQINRLFEIVYLLIDKKTMTAKKLAEHFEVSTRTILRDINILSSAGIPVYTAQGKGGGISLLDGYVLNKAVLSEEEQSSILLALQELSAAQHIETQSAIRKLKSMFVKQNTDWIEIDFSRWGSRPEDKKKFELIKTAIIGRQAVQFTYSNSSGQTSVRKVYPLKLLFKSMSWYLSAYCTQKEDYRIFKITRIHDIALTEKHFNDIEFEAPPVQFAEESSNPIELILLLPSALAYRVYDEFAESTITKRDDGSFVVKATFPNEYWLFDYLLSFGSDVEVLKPFEVRAQMIKMAEKIIQKHTDKI